MLLAAAACGATAQVAGPAPRDLVPPLQAAGNGQLTWLGIRAYEARLSVAPGFRHGEFARHAFALELAYQRAFSAAQIARRSIEEMRRAGPIAAEDAQRWQDALLRVLPDVQPGDRIAGVHRPGRGALFLFNGRVAGEIADATFAERFFGIWLAATTSEPALRQALLAGTPP